MDAQSLFEEGVAAIRDRRDMEEGRLLLTESLKLDGNNDMAWLWLARTVSDPQKRRQCIERALKINPANEQALALRARLQSDPRRTTGTVEALKLMVEKRKTGEFAAVAPDGSTVSAALPKAAGKVRDGSTVSVPVELTNAQKKRINELLEKGRELLEQNNPEGAIEQWVLVLDIQHDHEAAMKNAVQQLVRLKYMDDAKELVQKALDKGTTAPAIYLTAIDFAKRDNDADRLDQLREELVRLPTTTEPVLASIAEDYVKAGNSDKAMALLEKAIEKYPENQRMLNWLASIRKTRGRNREAQILYERSAKLGLKTAEGKEADKQLREFAPVVTDRERGSMVLAWREALGAGVIFLALGWQDAGLNLLHMGAGRWLGVALGILGGYLVVTATTSPQQQPLAKLLGGHVPDNKSGGGDSFSWMGEQMKGSVLHDATALPILPLVVRIALGVIGVVLLFVALRMVFGVSLDLLLHPHEVDLSPLFRQLE